MQFDITLCINSACLWDTLIQQACIGATFEGGVRRLALTDLDRQGRDFLVAQAEAAGRVVRVNAIGSLFACRSRHDNALPPIMTDSHIDTQPTGGKFDGNYGVFADIEVVRAFNDAGIGTETPIEATVWTDGEDSHFASVMMGSGMFVGGFALDAVLATQDRNGVAVSEAPRSIGYAGGESVGGRVVGAYFETHIEQGPVLEAHGKTTGVVTDALGRRWYDMVLTGMEARASPMPMGLHRDALLPAAKLVGIANHIALKRLPHACATVGCLNTHPSPRSVILGQVLMTIDFHTVDDTVLSGMDAALHEAVAELRTRSGIDIVLCQVVYFPPQSFNAMLVNAVRSGTRQLGLSEMDVISSADHDAVYLARVASTAMIFVPCRDGINHNEIEDARPEYPEAGTNVLLHAILQAAGRVWHHHLTAHAHPDRPSQLRGGYVLTGTGTVDVIPSALRRRRVLRRQGRARGGRRVH